MARAALGWRGADLAAKAGVGTATVARFELGNPVASDSLRLMMDAFEQAGIVLVGENEVSKRGGYGVRLR
jgi:transcriptional regulator with XRE-family HTH domain